MKAPLTPHAPRGQPAIRRFRFAPTPSHHLHVGSALAALIGWATARAAGGTFVLRIEDIDATRCTEAYERSCLDDLQWLGIDWDEGPHVGGAYGPYRQSERLTRYDARLEALLDAGRVYPCTCSRSDIRLAQSAPLPGQSVPYPGTCRPQDGTTESDAQTVRGFRLNVHDLGAGARVSSDDGFLGAHFEDVRETCGDFMLGRPGAPTYQLAVVSDDMDMCITDVVRGRDLMESTARQQLLHQVLDGEPPSFHHHPLVLGLDGRKFSKRAQSTTLSHYRAEHDGPSRLLGRLGALTGLFPAHIQHASPGDFCEAIMENRPMADGMWTEPESTS